MKVLFDYQDILEVVKNCVNPLVEGVTDAQRATHKEEKKKYFNALFLSINMWIQTTLRKFMIANH